MGEPVTERLPQLWWQGRALPESIDEEKRSFELVWTTGAKVRRGFWEPFDEELEVTDKACRLERFKSGAAPLLNSHSSWDLTDQIGVIEDAWIDGGTGRARVRMADVPSVAEIWDKVRQGVIRNVSVGYMVHKYLVEEREGEVPLRRAVDWTPVEISLVGVPADAGATVRAQDRTHPCVIERSGTPPAAHRQSPDGGAHHMTATAPATAATSGAPADLTTQAPVPPAFDAGAFVTKARKLNAGLDLVERGITEQWSMDKLIDETFNARAAADEVGSNIAPDIRMGRSFDDPAVKREAMADALVLRLRADHRAVPAAQRYRGWSMKEMALELSPTLKRGQGDWFTRQGALHTTSDFPNLLSNVANKTLLGAYQAATPVMKLLAQQRTMSDFKTASYLRSGEFSTLKKVTEHGEFTRGTFGENAETAKLDTYGRIFGVTRQALINDDLSAFGDLANKLGAAAAIFEEDMLTAAVVDNPVLSDGLAVFHATHGNLTTGANAPSIATVGTMRQKMRTQKGIDGTVILNIAPKFLLVPAALETVGDQLTATITAADLENVNPFSGRLTPVTNPRLDASSATAYYLFAADPTQPNLCYAYLESAQGPQITDREGFDVDGMEWRVRLDFAAFWIDFRGVQKHTGA